MLSLELDVRELVVRAAVVYGVLLLLMRASGKRAVGHSRRSTCWWPCW